VSITQAPLSSGTVVVIGLAARRLRGQAGLPQALWFLFWLAATLAAAAFGVRLLIVRALAGPGRERLPRLSSALTHDVLQRETESGGQRGHREERRGGDAAGLDLAQGFGGDAGYCGDLGHAARPARLAEQGAEPFPAGVFVVTERRSDHTVIVIPV
jgi:hypothetical protein